MSMKNPVGAVGRDRPSKETGYRKKSDVAARRLLRRPQSFTGGNSLGQKKSSSQNRQKPDGRGVRIKPIGEGSV